MKSEGLLSARGIVAALVLAIFGLLLAWLCFRTAMVNTLPPTSPTVMRLAPNDPEAELARASVALVKRQGLLDAATLNAVRRSAAIAPLDARPFLILGHQQLVDDQPFRAVKSMEAGQRLNPRNRLIHLILLERYLKTNRFTDAAMQFSLLARLVGAAQPTIAKAMAQMMIAPEMRSATRQTLRTDPALERAVLVALANGDSEPSDIFALASPAGIADAGDKQSWGPVLISRMVNAGQYQSAHNVWQRVYRLPNAAVAAPIFNPSFRTMSASPPFDWTLIAGGIGAADPRDGKLEIDYYGRDSGDLASQVLVLKPGRYQFAFVADGGKPDSAARLFWTLSCVSGDKARLMNLAVPMATGARRVAATLAVPSECPAQMLTLRGEAGEFPSPVNLTISDLTLGTTTETNP